MLIFLQGIGEAMEKEGKDLGKEKGLEDDGTVDGWRPWGPSDEEKRKRLQWELTRQRRIDSVTLLQELLSRPTAPRGVILQLGEEGCAVRAHADGSIDFKGGKAQRATFWLSRQDPPPASQEAASQEAASQEAASQEAASQEAIY